MDVPNLLIADSNEEFKLALAEALGEQYRVQCCGNGKDALELLRCQATDILVLDLMLPELDGISLLQLASQEGLCPKVLATTPLVSDYVLEAAEQLGIGYLIRKPCDVQATAMRVGDLNKRLHSHAAPADAHSQASDTLLALSIRPKHRGYHYLREGVVLMARNPAQSVTKELYPAIAALCDSTPKHVERSIRSALSVAWEHRDPEIWSQYFPTHLDRRPSNAVFISRLAEDLR